MSKVKSAITEFQNVQPTNEKMTDLQDTNMLFMKVFENNESMMDTFVKHLLKQVCLTAKIWSWKLLMTITGKDFMVEGQRVRTISKDAKIILEQLFSHMLKVKLYVMLSLKFT